MNIAYFTTLYRTPGLGPSRFAEFLREYDRGLLNITFFTDDKAFGYSKEVQIKKIPFISHLPGYWIIRSLKFYLTFKKGKKDENLIICSNAFEALFFVIFPSSLPLAVMINDDNYLFTQGYPVVAFKQQTMVKFLSRYFGFFIEKWIVKRADMIIACSEFLKEEIVKKYKPSSKVKVLYPAVDKEFFFFAPKEFNRDIYSILFLKQDWRRGGLEVVAKSLGQLKKGEKISLFLGGIQQKDRKKVLKIFSDTKFKGKIKWLGILTKEEVREAFKNSDLFLLPSRQEGFGISIIEAMAIGTPVLTTEIGGIPEATDLGKAVFWVGPDNPTELSTVIEDLFNDSSLLKSKLNYASEYVQRFSKNNLFLSLEDICNQLLKK